MSKINTAILKVQSPTGDMAWMPWCSREALERTKPETGKYLSKVEVYDYGKVPFEELPEGIQQEVRETLTIFRQSNVFYEYGRFTESPNACVKSHYEWDHFFAGTYTREDIGPQA